MPDYKIFSEKNFCGVESPNSTPKAINFINNKKCINI